MSYRLAEPDIFFKIKPSSLKKKRKEHIALKSLVGGAINIPISLIIREIEI